MASFVGKKIYSRWLWYAIDHRTGTILAFVLGIWNFDRGIQRAFVLNRMLI